MQAKYRVHVLLDSSSSFPAEPQQATQQKPYCHKSELIPAPRIPTNARTLRQPRAHAGTLSPQTIRPYRLNHRSDNVSDSQEYRLERDSMGEFEVPVDAYYGANTMRAVLNFPISDLRFGRSFIHAIASIKLAAAQVNQRT